MMKTPHLERRVEEDGRQASDSRSAERWREDFPLSIQKAIQQLQEISGEK